MRGGAGRVGQYLDAALIPSPAQDLVGPDESVPWEGGQCVRLRRDGAWLCLACSVSFCAMCSPPCASSVALTMLKQDTPLYCRDAR